MKMLSKEQIVHQLKRELNANSNVELAGAIEMDKQGINQFKSSTAMNVGAKMLSALIKNKREDILIIHTFKDIKRSALKAHVKKQCAPNDFIDWGDRENNELEIKDEVFESELEAHEFLDKHTTTSGPIVAVQAKIKMRLYDDVIWYVGAKCNI